MQDVAEADMAEAEVEEAEVQDPGGQEGQAGVTYPNK